MSLKLTPLRNACSTFLVYFERKLDKPKAIPSTQYCALSKFGSESAFFSDLVAYIFFMLHSSKEFTFILSTNNDVNKITTPEAIREQPILIQRFCGVLKLKISSKISIIPMIKQTKPATIDFQLYFSFIFKPPIHH